MSLIIACYVSVCTLIWVKWPTLTDETTYLLDRDDDPIFFYYIILLQVKNGSTHFLFVYCSYCSHIVSFLLNISHVKTCFPLSNFYKRKHIAWNFHSKFIIQGKHIFCCRFWIEIIYIECLYRYPYYKNISHQFWFMLFVSFYDIHYHCSLLLIVAITFYVFILHP